MRTVGIMIGSDSDLPQCLPGLLFLQEAKAQGLAKVYAVITNSIHRNTEKVLWNLSYGTRDGEVYIGLVDVWIIGAGCANHLTGTGDAYMRYHMRNALVPVIGVAFTNDDPEKTLAAILSIAHVPGSQVIFDRERHVGMQGFLNACIDAVQGPLPKLKLPAPIEDKTRTLDEAVEVAREMSKKK